MPTVSANGRKVLGVMCRTTSKRVTPDASIEMGASAVYNERCSSLALPPRCGRRSIHGNELARLASRVAQLQTPVRLVKLSGQPSPRLASGCLQARQHLDGMVATQLERRHSHGWKGSCELPAAAGPQEGLRDHLKAQETSSPQHEPVFCPGKPWR
jgi:hypothetical protein